MSGLILPNKWTSQPQVPVKIDWGNPLVQALGLVDVWIPVNGLFTPTLIRKFTPVASVGNFKSSVNSSGRSLEHTAATANNGLILANDADELFPVANTASIFVIRQSLDTTARTSTLFGYHVGTTGPDRTLAHVPYSDGNIYWDLGDITTSTRLSVASGGKTTNKEAYAFIGGPTKGREIWRNGIKLAGDATKTGARAATTASFRIGSASNVSTETNDLEGVNLFIIGSKEWPDWAINALSDNPWQIIKGSRRVFAAAAASGSTGTVAVTNANDTSSASGTTTVVGTVARTNANDTSTASGTTTVVGTVSVANAADTSSASGTTTVTGTSATTNANDTSSASGTTTVTGTSATTNANDTSSASGSVGDNVTGTVATTNANDTSAASGTTTVTGTLARTNANDTSTASGTTTVTGTAASTNANDTAAASGIAGSITGTVATTNKNDTVSASGTAGSLRTNQGGGWETYVAPIRKKTVKEVKKEFENLTYSEIVDEQKTAEIKIQHTQAKIQEIKSNVSAVKPFSLAPEIAKLKLLIAEEKIKIEALRELGTKILIHAKIKKEKEKLLTDLAFIAEYLMDEDEYDYD